MAAWLARMPAARLYHARAGKKSVSRMGKESGSKSALRIMEE